MKLDYSFEQLLKKVKEQENSWRKILKRLALAGNSQKLISSIHDTYENRG